MKLSEFEKEMHQKLCELGRIFWIDVDSQETKALNRLIKKGFAIYNGEDKCWEPLIE